MVAEFLCSYRILFAMRSSFSGDAVLIIIFEVRMPPLRELPFWLPLSAEPRSSLGLLISADSIRLGSTVATLTTPLLYFRGLQQPSY